MLTHTVAMSVRRLIHPQSSLLQSLCNVWHGGCSRAMSSTALSPAVFYQALRDSGVEFFSGVPDSLLKDFCAFVTQTVPEQDHFITANEGNAVAMCAGYHLATGKTGLVYLQNSGLGNMVNPLMSLMAPAVSNIPVLLLIGWRGEPGVKDEPQHVTQGRLTEAMLECMEIPCRVLPKDEGEMKEILHEAKQHFEEKKAPFGLLVKAKTFDTCKLPPEPPQFPLRREEALGKVISCLSPTDAIVSSTGMLSRELFEYREKNQMGHKQEFLTVGAMGHASCIALTIALNKPDRKVVALDGDGAVLMHMGTLATIGQRGPPNFHHVVFNNGAHDSVGGQPTHASCHHTFSITDIARACGYNKTFCVSTEEEIEAGMKRLMGQPGPVLMEVKIRTGSRSDLGRPTRTTFQNKDEFMEFVRS
ncbi:phosphonopyruvate decarboxylase-like [Littorina saxatilis]|uniref:phosphonopyruvate decarboxylase-like n=1 Tax=Littorina saxatilis TaxID=31220 RepID=UPI0038B45A6A